MCADAPDTSGINKAAEAQAGVARDALAWYKQLYADTAPDRAAAADRANKVSDAQLAAMGTATAQAQDYADYNRRTFRPLEQGLVDEANGYDTLDKRDQAAGKAGADIELAAAGARASGARSLERIGVNPNDGAYGAMERATDTNLALGKVDAMNKARENVRTVGHAMKVDAASLGRGLPGNQATQASLALTAGNNSVNNAQVPLNVANSGAQLMQQGYNTSIAGNNSAGNLYGQQAQIQNQANANDNAIFGALGQVGGAAIFKYSDKNMKNRKRPMKGEAALALVHKMPVQKWRYKSDSPANDGGKEHIGPMAQDVNKAAGEGAAPGGKMIDVGDMAGITLAAVQALDKKVDRLAKRRA